MVEGSNMNKRNRFVWFLIACVLCWNGCKTPHQNVQKENIIIFCPGLEGMDSEEFSHELSLKLAAYPYDIKKDPDFYNQVIIDLAANLAQQYQLLCGAKKKGIHASLDAVDAEEAAIREKYTEEEFQHLMLDEAVRYRVWKKKMEQDVTIREYIRVSLLESTSVTQEEIGRFYAREKELNGNEAPEWLKDTQTLILRVKEQKAQQNYGKWLEQLKEDCPVTINHGLLKKFLILPPEKGEQIEPTEENKG